MAPRKMAFSDAIKLLNDSTDPPSWLTRLTGVGAATVTVATLGGVDVFALRDEIILIRAGVRDLARTLDRARDVVGFGRARARARDLGLARDGARALNERIREICRLVCGAVVRTGVADLLRAITDGTRADTSWLTPSAISAEEHAHLLRVVDDFTGADLRDADVKHLDLIGVQWSKSTRWPDADADWITAASDILPNGNYVIRSADNSGGVVMPEVPVTHS